MFPRSLFAVLLTFFISLTSFAQEDGVSGRVEDAAGAPLPGAVVVLRDKKTKAERQVVTDDAGEFKFDGDPSGYEIAVSVKGFSSVTLDAGSRVVVTVNPQPIEEQVTVTAERTQVSTEQTAVPVTVVGRAQIEERAVNNVGDLFRSLPGTSTNSEGAFQVRPRIRGLESNRVLILVDGERLNNGRTSTGQSGIEPGLVDLSQIETVEVVRGSGSVLYGTDALAGTINIISRDVPARREGGFRLGGSVSAFYTSNENGYNGYAAVNGSSKLFAFRVSQSLERYGNYFTGLKDGNVPPEILSLTGITSDGEVLGSQSHGNNTFATGRLFLGDKSTAKFSFERRRAKDIGSAALVEVFNAFFPFSNRDKMGGRFDTVDVTDHLQRITVTGFHQKQDRNFTNILTVGPVPPYFPGMYQFSETITKTTTNGFDLQSDWHFGKRYQVIAGVSAFQDDNTDRRLFISSTTPTSPDQTIRTSRSVPDAKLSNFAAFAQNEFRFNDRFRLTGGIRYDRFATKARPTTEFALHAGLTPSQIEDLRLTGLTDGLNVTNTAITGDIGAVYNLTRHVTASARLGRSFRTPNIFERFFTDSGSFDGYLVGNPYLLPESGLNFDSSLRLRTTKVAASFTYFNNKYKNFLATPQARDRDDDPIVILVPGRPPLDVYQTKNVSSARIQGFEAEIEAPFKIKLGYLTPYGNTSYLRGDNLTDNEPLDSISPWRTNAGFRWQNLLRSYFMDYNVRIVNRQERVPPEIISPAPGVEPTEVVTPEPGFVTHSIAGGYYFRREKYNFNVNVGVSNIFNRSYTEQFVYAPARGRSFTIGTTFELK